MRWWRGAASFAHEKQGRWLGAKNMKPSTSGSVLAVPCPMVKEGDRERRWHVVDKVVVVVVVWWGWGHLVRFLSRGGVVVTHLVSHLISSPHIPLPAPSNLLYSPIGALRSARPLGVFVLFGLWLRDEENGLGCLVESITFRVMEVVTPCNTNLLVEYSAVHLNPQGYLYALFE